MNQDQLMAQWLDLKLNIARVKNEHNIKLVGHCET